MELVSSQFLAGVSLQKINLEEVLAEFADHLPHKQIIFLKSTVLHPAVLKHPLKWKYQIAFLRKAIYIIECISDDKQAVVWPEFYTHMEFLKAEGLKDPTEFDETFEHYSLPNTTDVISAVYDHHRYSGENELCSVSYLQVKLFMADWMTSNKERFQGKRILDLGSGNGAAGLIVNRTCAPKEIILSNIEPRENSILERNIEVNGCKNSVRVLDLNLNVDEVNEDLDRQNINPEVVIAVDEASVGEDLHRRLLDLLLILKGRKKSFQIYLVAVRNDADKWPLIDSVRELGLEVDKVGSSKDKDIENNFHWDDQQEMEVFLIERGNDDFD